MFLVSSLSSLIWGANKLDKPSSLIQLPCSFYQHDKKQQWKCLYVVTFILIDLPYTSINDGDVSICGTNIPYLYELVILPQEETEESNSEYRVGITESLCLTSAEGPLGLTAVSFTTQETKFLIELSPRDDAHILRVFELTLCKCLYENKFQQSSDGVPDTELSQLLNVTTTPTQLPTSPQSKPQPTNVITLPPLSSTEIVGQELFESQATLYIFDEATKEFKLVDRVRVHLHSDPQKSLGSILTDNRACLLQ